MKKVIIGILTLLIVHYLFAQEVIRENPKRVEFKTIGSISISADAKQSMYLNFGGPNINFNFGKYGIAYGMFPSLRFFYGDLKDATNAYRTKTVATPILGTGLSIYHKKFSVGFPMFYLPANNVWLLSGGFGYKF